MKGRRTTRVMTDKPKKLIACVLLVLEAAGIFAANFLYARHFSNFSISAHTIENDIELTVSKDVSLFDRGGNVELIKGTVIHPVYVAKNGQDYTVYFNYTDTVEHVCLSTEGSSFEEQDKIEKLMQMIEQKRSDEKFAEIKNGFLAGIKQAALWLVAGGILTFILTKKEKYLPLYLLPAGVAVFLFLEAFIGKLGGY